MARVSRQVHTDKEGKRTFADTGEKYKKEDLYKKKKKKKEEPVNVTTPKQQEINRQALEEKPTIELEAPEREPINKAVLAGVVGAGAVAGVAIGASLPVTAPIVISTATMATIRTAITNRAIVGKVVEMGIKAGARVTPKNIPIVARYATNIKSTALTKSWLTKIGGTATLVAIIGSYPFAGFIKEEALQTLGFGVNSAMNAGDLEGAQRAIDETNDILNPAVWEKIIATIPFANVVKELKDFYKAAATKNELAQKSLDIKREEQAGERETEFARERRLSDEAAFERKREFGEEESQRFEDIRIESEERQKKEQEEESQRYAQIEEESKARSLEEMRWKSEYYALIRDGKFEEADELLNAQS